MTVQNFVKQVCHSKKAESFTVADAKMTVTMKVVKNFLFLVAFGVVFSAQAATTSFAPVDEKPIVKVIGAQAEKMLNIRLANLVAERTNVTLRDKDGVVIFQDVIKKSPAYAKAWNVATLPAGDYTLHIENETLEIVQPVVIEDNAVHVTNDIKEYTKPVIEFASNKLRIAATPTQAAKTGLEIAIMDNTNNVLFETAETLYSKTEKHFDLSQLYPGEYQVKVTAADKSYFSTIWVQ